MSDIVIPSGPIWAAAAAESNWLTYRLIPQPDGRKPIKKPVLDGVPTDPKLCAVYTYEEASVVAEANHLHLGYLPREGSAIICLDLDGVLKDYGLVPEHAALAEEVLTYETFTEFSPSGTGIHILMARGDVGPILRDRTTEALGVIASDARFFSVSFDLVEDAPSEITDAPRLRALLQPHLDRWAEEEREDHADRVAGGDGWWSALTPDARVECAAAMLAALPDGVVHERDLWRDVTFALRLWPETFEVWDAWSARSHNYNPSGNLEMWDGRERKGERGKITIGTLIYMAGEAGLDMGRWKGEGASAKARRRMARYAEMVVQAMPEMVQQAQAHGAVVQEVLESQEEGRDLEADMQAALRSVLVAYVPSISARDARWFDLTQPDTLKGTVAEMWTCAGVNNVYGVPGLAQRMLPEAQRTASMPVIDPRLPYGFTEGEDGLGKINTYSHRAVDLSASTDLNHPALQSWRKLMAWVFPVEAERVWAEQWVAHKARRPWDRLPALVNATPVNGTGRGLFGSLLVRFFGIENIAKLTQGDFSPEGARFNEYMGSILAIMDEVRLGDVTDRSNHRSNGKAIYNVLKDCVDPGEKITTINRKYGTRTQNAQSFTSFVLFTNNEDALPLEPEDRRRWAVTSGPMAEPPTSFGVEMAALREDEAALDVIWRWLSEGVSMEGFNPFYAPETEARRAMVEAQITDLDFELAGVMEEAGWPLFMTSDMLRMAANLTPAGHAKKQEGGAGAVDAALKNWMSNHTMPLPMASGEAGVGSRLIKVNSKPVRVRVLRESLKRHGTTLEAVAATPSLDVSAAVQATSSTLLNGGRFKPTEVKRDE